MDYYKQKKMAQTDMFNIISKQERTSYERLVFKIVQKYGFGRGIVDKYIEMVQNMGLCRIEDGIIYNDDLIEKNKENKENDISKSDN